MAEKTVLTPEDLGMIGRGLYHLSIVQENVSGLVEDFGGEISNDQVTRAAFALTGEVFELAQELGWKNWKDNPEMTPEQKARILEEYADVVAFFGLMTYYVLRRTEVSPREIEAAYWHKTRKNIDRLTGNTNEEGYNGRT